MNTFLQALSKFNVYGEYGARHHRPYMHAITGFEGGSTGGLAAAYEKLSGIVAPSLVVDCGAGFGEQAFAFVAYHKANGLKVPVVAVDTWLGNVSDWTLQGNFPPYYHNNMGLYQGFRRFVETVNFHKAREVLFALPGGLSTLANLASQHDVAASIICVSNLSCFDGSRNWQLETLLDVLDDDGVLFGDRIWLNGASLPEGCHYLEAGGIFYACKSAKTFAAIEKLFPPQERTDAAQVSHIECIVKRLKDTIKAVPPKKVVAKLKEGGLPFFVRPKFDDAVQEGRLLESFNLTGNDKLTEKIAGNIHERRDPRVMIGRDMTLVCDGPQGQVPKVYVLTDDGTLINDTENILLEGFAASLLTRTKDRNTVQLSYSGKLISTDVPVLFLGGVSNFYHWHADHLSALFYLEEAAKILGLKSYKLAVSNVNAIARESLELLGYSGDDVIDITHGALKAPLMLSCIRNAAPTLNAHSARIFDRAATAGSGEGGASDLIYLTRADSSRRRVVNEEVLFARLEPLGFKLLRGADLSYREKVDIFSRAKCVVSPHGAGIANTLFSPAGCGVLEFFNPGPANNLNGRLLMAKGHVYKYIVFDTPHQGPQDFAVDVDFVVRETEKLLAEVRG